MAAFLLFFPVCCWVCRQGVKVHTQEGDVRGFVGFPSTFFLCRHGADRKAR